MSTEAENNAEREAEIRKAMQETRDTEGALGTHPKFATDQDAGTDFSNFEYERSYTNQRAAGKALNDPSGARGQAHDQRAGVDEVSDNSSGYRKRMAGQREGSMHEVSENSSGYRKRMAGQREGSMHEVSENSSGYRKRKAAEANAGWQDANPVFKMNIGAALEKAALDKKVEDIGKVAGEALRLAEALDLKDNNGDVKGQWQADIEYDSFFCTFVEDSGTQVSVTAGSCYLDDVKTSVAAETVNTTGNGYIYVKLTISTATWHFPYFDTTEPTATDDIKYWVLADVTHDADGLEEITPRHTGDIRYWTTSDTAEYATDSGTVSGIEPFWAERSTSLSGGAAMRFKEVSFDVGAADWGLEVAVGRENILGVDANGNTDVADGLRVMMWEDGNGNFIFTHPVPHMTPQYHVLTTLTAGYPVVTKVRATN